MKHEFKAVLTGSHAYGLPGKDSNVDLIVFVSKAELEKLMPHATHDTNNDGSNAGEGGESLRFGKLNLLCFTNETVYSAWREATRKLAEIAPVTREVAVDLIDKMLSEMQDGTDNPV